MKRLFLLSIVLMITTLSSAQNNEKTILKIGQQNISLGEFEYIYNKNNSVAQIPISKQEYLNLFIAYKLKVIEGKSLGIDTTKQYRNECDYYFNELIPHYQTDTIAQQKAETILKQRLKQEVNASHILISVMPNATAADTLEAYQKALKARAEIIAGADFAEVAKHYSDDPSARYNGGNLGYFSALQMVEPFETIAFTTPMGQVSEIFRTNFGYHFLIVHDRHTFPPQIQVAHIMKQFARNATQQQKDSLKHIADSLYQTLKNGADFSVVAQTESDDKQSAMRGGLIPFFSKNSVPSDMSNFATEAFALTADGNMSGVFLTKYGWHIIKRVAWKKERTDADADMMLNYAKQRNHPIAMAGVEAYAKRLINEYNFVWNEDVKQQVTSILNSALNDSIKRSKLSQIDMPLATFADKKILPTDPRIRQYWKELPTDNFSNIAQNILLTFDRDKVIDKNAEFRYIMQEYYDGLIVYEVNKRTIWDKADVDSIKLIKLYNNNLKRYTKNATFDGTIYFCSEPEVAHKVRKIAKTDPSKAAKMAFRVITGKQKQGDVYDDILWPNIPSEYVVVEGVYTNGEQLPFAEVRGQIISDYQQLKDLEFVEQLKAKYNPKIVWKLK